ncbi:hypothetical protein [Euzebya rosea]|uniref:hypothetical protein n=1 Tax=Euzebya rosea TaxID=2052804 RepID=UPI000D3E338B|nr:hypothetical protein [Euzebya rosea]
MADPLTGRQQRHRERVAEALQELADALAGPLLDAAGGSGDRELIQKVSDWAQHLARATSLPDHAWDDDQNEVLLDRLYGSNDKVTPWTDDPEVH